MAKVRASVRKVLLVAYQFPPVGAGGVARTAKFARYLPEFGWQPHVLTPRQATDLARDPTLLDELPDCVRIHRTQSFEYQVPRGLLLVG